MSKLLSTLNTRDDSENRILIEQIATFAEQVPQGGAWWIAQLERVNA
jgi:hypothetical protein